MVIEESSAGDPRRQWIDLAEAVRRIDTTGYDQKQRIAVRIADAIESVSYTDTEAESGLTDTPPDWDREHFIDHATSETDDRPMLGAPVGA